MASEQPGNYYRIMSSEYNKYSKIQLAAVLRMLDILTETIFPQLQKRNWDDLLDTRKLPNDQKQVSIRISDFGCSSGKNSVFLMKALFTYFQQHLANEKIDFHAFLLDLPSNDFNKVIQVFKEEEANHGKLPDFYLSTGAGDLYAQSLPVQSVNATCSFSALHWLSMPLPKYGAFQNPDCYYISCADPIADAVLLQQLLDHSRRDLKQYFLSRKQEVKVGGLIIFTCIAYDQTLYPTAQQEADYDVKKEGCLKCLPCVFKTGRLMGKLIHKAKTHFQLSEQAALSDAFMLPLIPRRKEDVIELFAQEEELQSSFEILYNDSHDVGDAYAQEGISREEVAVMRYHSTRGWSESSVRELLHFREEAVEWFFAELLQAMKKENLSKSPDTDMLFVVVRRIN